MPPRRPLPSRAKTAAAFASLQDGTDAAPLRFDIVADKVFQRYGRRCKPRTLAVNRGYCHGIRRCRQRFLWTDTARYPSPNMDRIVPIVMNIRSGRSRKLWKPRRR